jgi:hypothetical protein
MWEGRQSLGLTDPLGMTDVADPADLRTYIMTSTQHAPARLPLPKGPVFGNCQQQSNPNPQVWTMRALLTAMTGWVRDNATPPPSMVPRLADGGLVAPDQVRFPPIPSVGYGGVTRPAILPGPRVYDTLHVLDRGPDYRAGDTSGVITREPPAVGAASYGVLVPQVDPDGNDLGGIRSVFLQVPIGTYTGWNTGRKGCRTRSRTAPCKAASSPSPRPERSGRRRATLVCLWRSGTRQSKRTLLRSMPPLIGLWVRGCCWPRTRRGW